MGDVTEVSLEVKVKGTVMVNWPPNGVDWLPVNHAVATEEISIVSELPAKLNLGAGANVKSASVNVSDVVTPVI